jgi:predicted anti-sigma-YlaC factor YlaD
MTDTMQTIPTSTPPQPRASGRRSSLLAVGLASIIVVAVAVGIVFFRGNNSSSTGTAASQLLASAQLTSVQQSCQQWAASSAPTLGNGSPNSGWCTAMTDWMGQHLRNGRMTGAMMWGSATTLQTTCQQWMATGSGSTSGGTASPAWCGQMANWMTQHVGDWGNWMTSGNMMGR